MKKSKDIWFVVAVIAAMVLFSLLFIAKNKSSEKQTVKIGVVLPLTGNSAIIGEPKKRAFEIALEQYNKNNQELEIIYENSLGTAKDGIAAFNKLLMDKSFDCFYIDLTPIVNACVPQINSHKVITFAGSAEPEVTNLSDYLFRIFAGGDQEIEMMVDLLQRQNIKNIFVLHTNELYGINSCKLLKKLFESKGGKVIGSDEYPMNNGDFKAQLIKAKNAKVERIVLLGYGNEYSTLLKQAQEIGIASNSFFCNLGGSNKTVMELPANLTEGLSFIGPKFSYLLGTGSLEPEMKAFVDLYYEKYHENPDFRAAYAYDMVRIFMDVYGNGGKTQEQIISDIKKIQNFKGASGLISFMENGDSKTDLIEAIYSGGKIKSIENE